MFTGIFTWLLGSTLGRYLTGGIFLALIGSLTWAGCERNAKQKAEAQAELFKTAAGISQQQLLGAQEREEIRTKAAQKRGQINVWKEKNDLDSLSGDFNAAGGVRGKSGPGGGQAKSGAATGNKYTDGTGTAYQEAP